MLSDLSDLAELDDQTAKQLSLVSLRPVYHAQADARSRFQRGNGTW